MENCEAMKSSSDINSLICILFKKCFNEIYGNSKFHIFLIFYLIFFKFSMFGSKSFTLSY